MFEYSEGFIRALIEGVYEGEITRYDLPEGLYYAIADYLKKGLYQGFEYTLDTAEGADLALLTELRENIYMFSAAKTYQQVKDMTEAVVDGEGKLRSFKDFAEIADGIFGEYNKTWLKTEYDTTIGMAQNAAKWNDIEAQKEVLPVLRYSAVGDENTCEICGPLEGMTAPVDDPVWDSIMPENHFGCRCLVEQLEEGETTKNKDELVAQVEENMNPMFIMNPGKDKVVFSEDHPYFHVPKDDTGFAKTNFGLPIPDED